MEDDRQFKGIWIPAEIWLNKDLTLQEKVMLVEIDSLESEEKGCYKSNKGFAEFFGLTKQRISIVLQTLEKKGYIKVDFIRKGKEIIERQIRINRTLYPEPFKVSTKIDRGVNKTLIGCQQNFKESNTYSNTYIKENISKDILKKSFKKPTLDEIDKYIKEKNFNIDPKTFYEYFEANDWKDSKGNKVKSWKQKLITWNSFSKNKKKEHIPEWMNKDLSKKEEKKLSKEDEEWMRKNGFI